MAGTDITGREATRRALRVFDVEMEPRFWAGEIAIFDESEAPYIGNDAIIKLKDGRLCVRHLAAMDDATVTVETYTPSGTTVLDRDEIAAIFPVLSRVAADQWDCIIAGAKTEVAQ